MTDRVDEMLADVKALAIKLDAEYACFLTWGKHLHEQVPDWAFGRHAKIDETVEWARNASESQRKVLKLLAEAPDLEGIAKEFFSMDMEEYR